MAEQIVFTNAIVQTREKYFSGHDHLGEPSIYGLTTSMTRHAGIRSSYNLKRHGFGPGKQTSRDAARRVSDNITIADRGGDGASPVSTFGFFQYSNAAVQRTFRRSGSWRRSRRMRGCDGLRPHGAEDRALYLERRSDCADVVQPRRRRDRQGTLGARSGRSRRYHGRDHRRRRNPVPPVEYVARPRRVVAAGAMRQASLPPEDAGSARVAAESHRQAGRSVGCDFGRAAVS